VVYLKADTTFKRSTTTAVAALLMGVPLACSLKPATAAVPPTGAIPSWVPEDIVQRLESPTGEDDVLRVKLSNPETGEFLTVISLGKYVEGDIVFGIRADETCFGLYNAAKDLASLQCVSQPALAKPIWSGTTDKDSGRKFAVILAPFAIDFPRTGKAVEKLSAHPNVAILTDGMPSTGVDIVVDEAPGQTTTYQLGR